MGCIMDKKNGKIGVFYSCAAILPSRNVTDSPETRALFEAILSELSEREAQVVRLHYGLNGVGARKIAELSRIFNMSRGRISTILTKAIGKMRHPYRSRRLLALIGDNSYLNKEIEVLEKKKALMVLEKKKEELIVEFELRKVKFVIEQRRILSEMFKLSDTKPTVEKK